MLTKHSQKAKYRRNTKGNIIIQTQILKYKQNIIALAIEILRGYLLTADGKWLLKILT